MTVKVEKVGGVRDSLVFVTRLWSTLVVVLSVIIIRFPLIY